MNYNISFAPNETSPENDQVKMGSFENSPEDIPSEHQYQSNDPYRKVSKQINKIVIPKLDIQSKLSPTRKDFDSQSQSSFTNTGRSKNLRNQMNLLSA